MCVPSVPKRPKCVKSGKDGNTPYLTGSDAPRDASRARRTRRRQRQQIEGQEATQGHWKRFLGRVRPEGAPSAPLYSLELGSSHTGNRRRRFRQDDLILSPADREVARYLASEAAGCGTRFACYRRYTVAGEGVREERLVCQKFCGLRACERCDKAMRARECARVEGNWRQFHTLGIPSDRLTVAQAWRLLRRARAKLFKRLERHAARRDAWAVRVRPEDVLIAFENREAAKPGRVRRSVLDYAWTVEPHVSGFPHLHFVTNTTFLDYRWLRRVWSECTGRECRWSKTKDIKNADGICRYLSKYISKTVLTLDLSALLYRQRLWATSQPAPPRRAGEWIEDFETTAAQAREEADKYWSFRESVKWNRDGWKRGAYVRWSREWPLRDWPDAWAMARETGHVFDPERQPERKRKKDDGPFRWADVLRIALEEGDTVPVVSAICLTELVKVCFTPASGS